MSVKERIDLERIPVDDGIGKLRHWYPHTQRMAFPFGPGAVAYCGWRKQDAWTSPPGVRVGNRHCQLCEFEKAKDGWGHI